MAPSKYWQQYDTYIPNRGELHRRLDQMRYRHLKKSTPNRLRYLMTRARRGLMSYEKRDKTELRLWCSQRHITTPQDASQKQIVHLLEQADENNSFNRFQNLPAELRVQIYELHLHDMPKVGANTFTPPITRVSRLLRQEALPIFYAHQPLRIRINAKCRMPSTRLRLSFFSPVSAYPDHFIRQAPEKSLQMVKNVELELSMERRDEEVAEGSVPKRADIVWQLSLDKENGKLQAVCSSKEGWIDQEAIDGFEESMTPPMVRAFARLEARQTVLQRGDEELMREIIWDAYSKHSRLVKCT